MESTNDRLQDRVVHLIKAKRSVDAQLATCVSKCEVLTQNVEGLSAELHHAKQATTVSNHNHQKKLNYRKRKIEEMNDVIEQQRKDLYRGRWVLF